MRARVTTKATLKRREMRRLTRSLERMLDELLPGADIELSVALVHESDIKKLNSQYLGKDETTDVLAFPQMSPDDIAKLRAEGGVQREPLGDVVVCLSIAKEQAAERGETLEEEIELLCAHGLLHLVGYRDDTEEGAEEMVEMERMILGRSIIR